MHTLDGMLAIARFVRLRFRYDNVFVSVLDRGSTKSEHSSRALDPNGNSVLLTLGESKATRSMIIACTSRFARVIVAQGPC